MNKRVTVNLSYEAYRSEVISIVSNGTQLTNPYDHMGVIVKLDEKYYFCDSAWAGLWYVQYDLFVGLVI